MTVTARLMKFNSPEITIACSTGSGASAIALGKRGAVVELKNFGSVEAYVNIGSASIIASSSSTLIPAGQTLVYELETGETHAAGMTISGATNVRIKIGEGI